MDTDDVASRSLSRQPLSSGAALAFLLAGADRAEQRTRLRELRALSFLIFGSGHKISDAFSDAVANPKLAHDALRLLEAAPTLQRRKLLAIYGALMPARPSAYWTTPQPTGPTMDQPIGPTRARHGK